VIALHVARDDQVLGPVDDQVDEDVRPGAGVQDVEQVPYSTPGTRPAARSLRATPLPVPSLGSATSLTSAMVRSFEAFGVSAGHGTNRLPL